MSGNVATLAHWKAAKDGIVDPEPEHAPQDLAAESALLGSVLFTGTAAMDRLVNETGLQASHFYRPDHAEIYTAMGRLLEAGKAIDVITVTGDLTNHGSLITRAQVEQHTITTYYSEHYTTYADQIIYTAIWRARQHDAFRMVQAVRDRDEHTFTAITATTDSTVPERGATLTGADLADQFLEAMNDPSKKITSPWKPIDRCLAGGARPGDTTVIATWSSFGKSVICGQWSDHVAAQDAAVTIYTNEMSPQDLAFRLVAGQTNVAFEQLMEGTVAPNEQVAVAKALRDLKVNIVPADGWTSKEVSRHIRRHRWDFACLDLFHRLPDIEKVDRIDAAINELCTAAAQADTHLLVALQLNLERAKDGKKPPPTGRDLRGSAQLYNNPANVLLLHRDQKFNDVTERYDLLNTGAMWLEKARNGRPGYESNSPVVFKEDRMQFDSTSTFDGWTN